MLRDGSGERRGYSPGHLFSDLPQRSSLENGTAGGYRAHICGFWRPVHCLSATAVCLGTAETDAPHWKICVLPSKGTETATPPHTLPRVRPLFTALCALGWQIGPVLRGDLPIKNEHRCHARDGAVSVHRWRRTRRCFTADVSVFMAHLPGKPFGSVKLGQKSSSFLASA